MSIDIINDDNGSDLWKLKAHMRRAEVMTPTLPKVSANTCKNTAADINMSYNSFVPLKFSSSSRSPERPSSVSRWH